MPSEEFGAHSSGSDPKTMFLPDPERKVTWLHEKAIPLILAITGYGTFTLQNYMQRMPLHAGIWRHALAMTAAIPVGMWWHNYREERLAEKDMVLHWYINEHPEEFPTPERVKIGDMMKTWIPVR